MGNSQYEEIEIKYLEKGDRIISIDNDNNIIDDIFIDFLHYDKTETEYEFKVLHLANQ